MSSSTSLFLLLAICQLARCNFPLVRTIRVGGLFEVSEEHLENDFKAAIDRINLDPRIAPRIRLIGHVEVVKPRDSFRAIQAICGLVEDGVWAIMGGQSAEVTWLIRSISHHLRLPYISLNYEHKFPFPFGLADKANFFDDNYGDWSDRIPKFSLNFYPAALQLSKAYLDMVRNKNWRAFTIIYEENEELILIKDLLRIQSFMSNDFKVRMKIIRFDQTRSKDYKKILKDLRDTETNFVLSVPLDKVVFILEKAVELGMMTEYHNYLIANLDLHLLDLRKFHKFGTNITGLSLLDPDGYRMTYPSREWLSSRPIPSERQIISTQRALIYDAVALIGTGFSNLLQTYHYNLERPNLFCEVRSSVWNDGLHLINAMRMASLKGFTGLMKFDKFGFRQDFKLNILRLRKEGFSRAAEWTKNGINETRGDGQIFDDTIEAMRHKIFIVSVPVNAIPYVFMKENHTKLEGNDKFDGFCIDLLEKIQRVLQEDFQTEFNYEFKIVKDGAYGSYNPTTQSWDGMLGELISREADLAIADLTMTHEREKGVDFTMPFMNLGISILFKKPSEPPRELFAFMKPFSIEVWIAMASAYIGVSLVLWAMSRFSPPEWIPTDPSQKEDEEGEVANQFSVGASLWFSIGSVMQQGSDLAQRSSARILASLWWFFTLIIVSSYTANLAATLTLSRMASPIESAEDLAMQTTIQYGCKDGGSTKAFFKNSNHSIYSRMWSMMEADPSVMAKSNSDGVDRVKKGGYAFLMESTSIEYMTQRECDLVQIGQWLDNKGYGIATPPDSPYRTIISRAIVKLQEKGELRDLKDKWWNLQGGGICGEDAKKSAGASALDISSLGGAFVLLVVGAVLSFIFAVLEFIWKTKKKSRHEREAAGKLLWQELVRIFTCGSSSRPALD